MFASIRRSICSKHHSPKIELKRSLQRCFSALAKPPSGEPQRQPSARPNSAQIFRKLLPYTSKYDGERYFVPQTWTDKVVKGMVKLFRFPMDTIFREDYMRRVIYLETVAAVPGLVAGSWLHFHCLRRLHDDAGWIIRLLDESENERMHLTAFLHYEQPGLLQRFMILATQIVYTSVYFVAYAVSPKACHRFVGMLEEEAVFSYNEFLKLVDSGKIPNGPAPKVAKDYWELSTDATLRDLIVAIRDDECEHRDINHAYASEIQDGTSPYDFEPISPTSRS
ncbi:mitochondrial alternative oxidase form 1 (AOX1) [Andalucia godoyi]|uniref:Mitochondrial alternative oxidase form 1 (AOX1) n=1 Tax=Andalucia godoyi TaxID=505711 RepID=A0A8K0AIY7_ANDGO|nr:mitochondrial alternative oxidase form 1 (AOX1) [Andalucia godoyi]|eukprot:ANDGO_03233.mRNA.1 mitochondrial alternative oxidase form 1 (AOX1)